MLPPTLPKDNVSLHSSASAKHAMPTPGATLVCLNEILLDLILASLEPASLMKCQLVCRVLRTAAQKDDLWRAKCLEDWGEARSVLPEKRSEPVPTYLEAWRGWRKSFRKYKAEDVKRVAVWWASIEEWMKVNLHEVLDSLNEGVSDADLDKAEKQLGWLFPTHLRLLYRFHNGQWLPWGEKLDASFGVDEGRPSSRPKIEGSGVSLGLLGGYCFYNRMATSKLFSLQRGVQAGLATAALIRNQTSHFLEGQGRCWSMDLEAIRNRGGFLFAASHLSKRAWVGKDGNVRFDGNFPIRGAFDAAPVVDATAAAGGGGRPEGNLMTWLEEYLRRLQRGHYGVRSRWREPYVNFYGMRRERRLRGVWLFPEDGGQYCVTEVTRGVQVQVAPVFVPEACEDRESMLWTYSVRMKLLRGHPTRPQLMSSCQLSTRHWEIDGLQGFHREISGEGVIGEYPLLKLSGTPVSSGGANSHDDGSSLYNYESCTTLENPPGTMGGYFTFMPGDLSAPTGPAFKVRVPKFELVQPDFIF